MYLKNYQQKVVKYLKQFLSQPIDNAINGLGKAYPNFVVKVPTGGGKTLLAVEAIRHYQHLYTQRKTGLVVWLIPSETIYKQTLLRIRDKGSGYRQLLDQASGGNTIIIEKGQKLTNDDIENNLIILFVMLQSISRHDTKEGLKIFQDSGGYESFFPLDYRYDLHKILLDQVPNLDHFHHQGISQPLIKTSMANAIRISNPLFIIDEIHKVFSPLAQKTINSLNPQMVLGFTATPKSGMNILVNITGAELQKEEMIKLDLNIFPPSSKDNNDWKAMVKEVVAQRHLLEEKSLYLKEHKGLYIRPIALFQVERTGKDQRGQGWVHSLDVRELLISQGISSDHIAIKSSSQNDIEDIDLFSPHCNIRYIITKEALREGWDCSFAYVLGIIPSVHSKIGLTQLVGRILRQPFAKKTGIQELDESYVYYSQGDTNLLLEKISQSLKNEGLEDLATQIRIREHYPTSLKSSIHNKKIISPKKELDTNINIGGLNYAMDIKSRINFKFFDISEQMLNELQREISSKSEDKKIYKFTTLEHGQAWIGVADRDISSKENIDIGYATRRFAEVIDNPFLARQKTSEWVSYLIEKLGKDFVNQYFIFIVSFITQKLEEEKTVQEKEIIKTLLDSSI
jgi:type III restriction enzyme